MEGNEVLRVLLFHVEAMPRLVRPGLDKDETVRIIGAGVEIVGDAARLGPRGGLRGGQSMVMMNW